MPFWKKTDKGGKKKPPKPAVPRTAQQSIPMQRMFEHPLHGDGLLCCPGNSGLRRLFLAALIGLFPKRHGLTLLSSKSHSSYLSYKVESSGAGTAPEHSATAAFPVVDRFSRTYREKMQAA